MDTQRAATGSDRHGSGTLKRRGLFAAACAAVTAIVLKRTETAGRSHGLESSIRCWRREQFHHQYPV
jgi:hypothetical protein